MTMRRWILTAGLLVVSQVLFGQMFPERRSVRQGNREYGRENYVEAEARYMGALSDNPASYEANFNLGNAYFRQGRIEEAEQRFQNLAQVPYLPEQWAQTHYNLGNTQVVQYKNTYNREKLTQALESYKQSLRLNPDDQEAKFNLAYVQKLLEQDNEGGGGGGGDDQNNQNPDSSDQNQEGQGDQNPDQNPDQNSDPDNGEGDPDQSDQGNNDPDRQPGEQPSQQQGRMSREEAEQLLNAMQNSEDQTREKVDKQQAGVVGRSGKNW